MSHSTSGTVECPLCGEEFDPTAAGGWCTNSDCGEWQHEPAAEQANAQGADGESDDGTDGTRSGEAPEATEGIPDAESDAGADPATRNGRHGGADAEDAADSTGDGPADDRAEPADTGGGVAAVEAGAAVGDPDGGPAEDKPATDDAEAETESGDDDWASPGAGAADGADDGADSADDAESAEDADLACPSCGESVAPEDNFCANCGEDVSALEPGPLTECPACEADVDPEDNFCATCGEDLDAHRSGAATDDSGETAGTGAETDDAEQGAEAGDEGAGAADATAEGPESLVLVVRNREVQVWDGDTVGRTIRSIVMNTGGDEEDAVRIHREHVQFVREGGQFHLVALGQNPTVVNGESLDEGDRVPVSPGDRIELSNVVTMRVEAP